MKKFIKNIEMIDQEELSACIAGKIIKDSKK